MDSQVEVYTTYVSLRLQRGYVYRMGGNYDMSIVSVEREMSQVAELISSRYGK